MNYNMRTPHSANPMISTPNNVHIQHRSQPPSSPRGPVPPPTSMAMQQRSQMSPGVPPQHVPQQHVMSSAPPTQHVMNQPPAPALNNGWVLTFSPGSCHLAYHLNSLRFHFHFFKRPVPSSHSQLLTFIELDLDIKCYLWGLILLRFSNSYTIYIYILQTHRTFFQHNHFTGSYPLSLQLFDFCIRLPKRIHPRYHSWQSWKPHFTSNYWNYTLNIPREDRFQPSFYISVHRLHWNSTFLYFTH